ncbi:MAG: tetratricopeptide repeat protein [Syntrophaceae bacterium]|nr:tetratricopeptide repeat protein [Syntrophaceae bacterium]
MMELVNNTNRYYHLYIAAIITTVVCAVFSEVLTAQFVMWDDDLIIYKNPKLGPLSINLIFSAFTDVDTMMRYNPLTLIGWSITYQYFGLNPFGYHMGNWLLHGLNSGLLFLIIRKILLWLPVNKRSEPGRQNWALNIAAVAAALFWAIHPLRVEPVAWATDRTYCQAVFFLLLTTLCYLKANDSEYGGQKYRVFIVLSLIFYIMSLFSYAIGITYFLIFVILDVYLFKRMGGENGWGKTTEQRNILYEKIIFALPAIMFGLISVMVRMNAPRVWLPPVPLEKFGLFDRVMQAMYVLFYYIYKPFYPFDLSPVYNTLVSFNPLSMPFLLSAMFVLSIITILYINKTKWPLGFALVLSYIALMIPLLGFFEHPHYTADRYSILASMCISVLIAFVIYNVNRKHVLAMVSVSMIIVIMSMTTLTYKQIKIWTNSETLFVHMIEKLKDDRYRQDIYWRLGRHLYLSGRIEEGINNYHKALNINPMHPVAHDDLAVIEYRNGNIEKAKHHLQMLLKINPRNEEARYRLVEMDSMEKNIFTSPMTRYSLDY